MRAAGGDAAAVAAMAAAGSNGGGSSGGGLTCADDGCCGLCHDPREDGVTAGCGHSFCRCERRSDVHAHKMVANTQNIFAANVDRAE
jgi:hypothetical protein